MTPSRLDLSDFCTKSCQASPCLMSWWRKAVGRPARWLRSFSRMICARVTGQVFSRGDIHHGNLLSGADQLLELLERDVAALLSIVELSVRVSLDDIRHG